MVRLAQPLLPRANGATRARPPRLAPSPSRLAKKISPSAPRSVPIPAARRPGDRPQASQARRRVGRQEGRRRRRGEGQGREELKEIFTRAEKYVKEYRDQVSIRHVRRFRARQRRPEKHRCSLARRARPPRPRSHRPLRERPATVDAARTSLPGRARARGPPRVAPSRGTRRRVLASAAASRPLGLSLGLRRGAREDFRRRARGFRPSIARPSLFPVHR